MTSEQLDRILVFSPIFEQPSNSLYEVRPEVSVIDPYVYAPEVDQFIQTLYQEDFLSPFDWIAWSSEADTYVENPSRIKGVDLETLKKLFTCHVRTERFRSGHLAQMIENGHIGAMLKRLAVIRSEMEEISPD
ncbi:MAG: hypothetical protein HLUCCA11_20550 [Phormidesmis priestleyi Ana]|uniref:Uncharacterized protein n=1 Tax=Phormidesmis priestleyi Ana TaxID=1666911 RepID=A0A0P8D9R1_9CYAN|nr:MAG: hypothetical protein HLUCCA11_20550 [Phormidesmis priestleyi Ana]